jgi:raffinose/stachyose/melibiose transport system permease protein
MTLTLALLESREQYLTRTTHYSYYGVIFATIPMLLAYVFLQRYLIEGMTAGSVKG